MSIRLAAIGVSYWHVLYDAACVLALGVGAAAQDGKLNAEQQKKLAEQYAGRSLALLRRAQAAGYLKNAAVVARLQQDADLAALREREDFKKFLGELRMK